VKTKIYLIGFAIVLIAVVFAVPAFRDGQEAERYDGRPFPDRANRQLQSVQVPAFVEPRAVEANALTASDVAPPVSSSFGGGLSIQPAEAPTVESATTETATTFALDRPNSRDSDSMIFLDDESPASQSKEVYVDSLSVAAAPPVLEDWALDTTDESVGLQLDELMQPKENPFDKPIHLPDTPIETSAVSMVQNDGEALPTIETGTGFAPFGNAQSRLEINPYADSNATRLASRDQLRRPVAKPSFDQTPITALDTTETTASSTDSTQSIKTSIMIPGQEETHSVSDSSPLDTTKSFDQPTPVGTVEAQDAVLEPLPAPVPIDAPTSPLLEAPIHETPTYSNDAPVVPLQGAPSAIPYSTDRPSFSGRNASVGTLGGSSYLQNSWRPSIFQTERYDDGNRYDVGYGYESGFPSSGNWGDTSSTLSFGGWFSAGYHDADNQLFNNRPDNFALHQGWLFLEKSATADSPIGFRVDAVYGIDGTDTQAFGNEPGNWDYLNGLDFGAYSWAIPQAYLDVAIGEFNVRVGHFFTLLGYETVAAPDNFFYSHAMTMYNSEPFTHTGVLVNRKFGDFDVYGGWTLGWDSGFDRFGDAGSWLGGFTYEMNEDASFSYFSTAGNLGARGDDGYSQSVVLNLSVTERLNYVLQSDYLRVASTGEDNVGVAQYATYSLTEKVSLGSRLEWWKGDVLTGYAPHGGTLPAFGSLSYFATTIGANIRPTDSLVIRPEIRHDWSPAANYDETYFGIDAVWSF